MGMRKDHYCSIINLQQSIEYYSRKWVEHGNPTDYAMYLHFIRRLIDIKLQILKHERIHGWNN